MLTKEDFLNAVRDEIRIIKHLGTKVQDAHLAYKPSEKQRTVLQLMQYLSYCGMSSVTTVITGSREHGKKMNEDSQSVNMKNFSSKMDEQLKTIELLLKDFDDKALAERDATKPWGVPQKAGFALINKPLKFLTAYRMQFFLYLKQAGVSELGTANCWLGVDPEK